MQLIDQKILGAAIIFLLGMLVAVKRVATGSVFDKPKGNLMVQLVNILNLFSLLVVNPLAAILLIAGRPEIIDPTRMIIDERWVLIVIEITGLVMYVTGFILMAWALITLGRNYQLGGAAPRTEDNLVMEGPYRLIRHPMYTAALSISAGLACMTGSSILFYLFCIYLVLILLLIPVEEEGLRNAYGEQYGAYQEKSRKFVPLL